MEKLRLLVFSILLFPLLIQAQTFHLILMGDTNDSFIGDGCLENSKRVKRQVKEISDACGFNLVVQEFSGNQFNAKSLKTTIEKLTVGDEDIVWLYYSGHGVNNQVNQWPRLLVPGSDNVILDKLHGLLVSKGARFTLSTGDCCNYGASESKASEGLFYAAPKSMLRNQLKEENFIKIFKESEGDILMSGSLPGEFSKYNSSIGGLFTFGICKALYNIGREPLMEKVNWENVMEAAQKSTQKISASLDAEQNPQYRIKFDDKIIHSKTLTLDNSRPPVEDSSAGSIRFIYYFAKKGDNLHKIMREFKVSKEVLFKHNSKLRENPDLIKVKDRIKIPVVN